MILVVDTNIIFSALINPKSTIGEIILNSNAIFTAPLLLKEELNRYMGKIESHTKLSEKDLLTIKELIFKSIRFVSEDLIKQENWKKAYDIAKVIDEKDTPFVALSLELNAKLWTGDIKLIKGINKKVEGLAVTTSELKALLSME